MKTNSDKIENSIAEIRLILNELIQEEIRQHQRTASVHPFFQKSASNLIHYRALRRIDITRLQKNLGNLGLSRIARSEAHVVASLQNCRDILKALIHDKSKDDPHPRISIKKARKLLTTQTKELLGYRSKGRRVRIMVTLPSDAAHNYDLVHGL
ncbi:MAG: hypothetical protein AAF519_07710, partial [Bacteroidota bacterium]